MDERAGLSKTTQMDRRRFIRAAGTLAWTTPVVMTLSAEPVWAAAKCTPRGRTCGRVTDCSAPGGVCTDTGGFLRCCTGCVCENPRQCKVGKPCKCFGNCSPSER